MIEFALFSSAVHFFNVLVFLDILLAIICCILLVKVPTKYAIKLVTIPLILFISFILLIEGEKLFGRPYDVMPKGQFEFLDYRVTVVDGIKRIELWVLQQNKSRLHIIDYDESTEQKLSKAKTQRQAGNRGRGEFSIKPGDNKPDLSIGDIPRSEILIPKENLPEPKPEIQEDLTKEWNKTT
jgi:hypothetical protein